jgi:Sap, sulfolipid-1-addressing protein
MSLEALVLGLVSGLRPGTSLAAVLALLKTPQPRRPLLFFTAAGLVSSWAIGLLVVGVFHGANVAVGGSTFTAALDVAFGAAALGFAAGLQRGWVQPTRRRSSSASATDTPSRFGRRLHNPSAGVAAAAGVATHLPGLIYLVALNAIASERPALVDAGLQVAIYDGLWFLVPLASLVLVVVRPGAAPAYLDAATAWVRRHEHATLVAGSLVLGAYLVAKGTASLLT